MSTSASGSGSGEGAPAPRATSPTNPSGANSTSSKESRSRPPLGRQGSRNNGGSGPSAASSSSTSDSSSSSSRNKSGKSGRSQHSKKVTAFGNKMPEYIGPYKIQNEIGRGAFGRVYRCTDRRTLQVRAIKLISRKNMNAQQKQDVESEVELLASLPPHENIVRYIGTFNDESTTQFLCIVLEFVDLGSLQSLIRKNIADVTEQNVAGFIFQILCGLNFLHEQGIIHRDIKAANVLINNEGVAKLADFGVAIKRGDGGKNNAMDEEVAGSPYWMAPEIIEMRGQLTPACDIWAVGATAIELFTGHPPYHNLQAMSALFRIVQDPHPEIPAKASKLFKDFLYQCFCKDPSRRPTARDLTSHKWITSMIDDERLQNAPNHASSSSSMDANTASAAASAAVSGVKKRKKHENDGDDEKQISEEHDDDTDPETDDLRRHASLTGKDKDLLQSTMKMAKKQLAAEIAKQKEHAKKDKEKNGANTGTFKLEKGVNGQTTATAPDGSVVTVNSHVHSLGLTKLSASNSAKPTKPTSSSKKNSALKKAKTQQSVIRSKKNGEKKEKPDKKTAPKKVVKEDEEDSPWDEDGDDDEEEEEDSDSDDSDDSDSDSDSDSDDSDDDDDDDDDESGSRAKHKDDEESEGGFLEIEVNPKDFDDRFDQENIAEESDKDDSDWVDDEDDNEHENSQIAGNEHIREILKRLDEHITHLQHHDEDVQEATPRETAMIGELEKLNDIFRKTPNLIGQCIKLAIIPIMEMLSIESTDVKCTALQTMNIIISDPKEGRQHLQTLCLVQFIPAIGNMVRSKSIKVKNAAAPFLKKFCEDTEGSKKKRNFVREMFIACGGISILVDCLRNKYSNDNKEIIFVAVDCIYSIFESKVHNRRDLGRLFTKAKLLKRLLKRLHDSFGDVDDINTAIAYGEKMAEIFFRIAELTDRVVKTHIAGAANNEFGGGMAMGLGGPSTMMSMQLQMQNLSMNIPTFIPKSGGNPLSTLSEFGPNGGGVKRGGGGNGGGGPNHATPKHSILAQLLGLLPALEENGGKRKDILLRILKSFMALSMDSYCIGPLIEAKTMSTVVPFLKSPDEDIQTCVVRILWNMTRVNNSHSTQARREAAENGAIPVLKQLIANKSHKSMYFLVQTICKFPNDAHKETLFEMKKHNMCQFYINMTKSGHSLSLDALSALARWIENDEYVPRLEFVLCQPDNITQLILLFRNPVGHKNNKRSAGNKNVPAILDAFRSLIYKSPKIADNLGDSNVFLEALGGWLLNDHFGVDIVKNLLEIVYKMFEYLQPSSKKKCAKTMLPIIDRVYLDASKRKKYALLHLVKIKLIPAISLHIDQADIDDLCPELIAILTHQ